MQRQQDSAPSDNDWVRVTSNDGFSFIVRRRVAKASGTMRNMLDVSSSYAEAATKTCPSGQRAIIAEKLVEYMSFKSHYETVGPREDIPTHEFMERIPREIVLELLLAADYQESSVIGYSMGHTYPNWKKPPVFDAFFTASRVEWVTDRGILFVMRGVTVRFEEILDECHHSEGICRHMEPLSCSQLFHDRLSAKHIEHNRRTYKRAEVDRPLVVHCESKLNRIEDPSMTISTSDTVTAKIAYLSPPPDGVRAYQTINSNPKTGERDKNVTRVVHEVPIENIRGKEHLYNLDNAGFQFYNRPTRHTDFRDDKKVEESYYPESIELVKELTGASRAVIFDHTRRFRQPGELDDSPQKRQPVAQAHVDQTTKSSIARVHRHLPPSDAPALLSRRFQIINMWRPIGNPAYDWPLTLCDYRSVNPKNDTFPVALVYPDREGETMGVKHSLDHQWKYVRGMTPDEIVLIKCFDSVQDGSVAVFTPHTGFEDPTTPEGSPFRESIELRFLVFYDD